MNNPTIEDYMLSLAKLGIFIQLLSDEQRVFRSYGILTESEEEISKSIQHDCKKLLVLLDDQVRFIGDRTPQTWEETLETIRKKLQ